MSYRSLKHVLGETSLERKCRFLFGICLLTLITGSFWLYGSMTDKLVERQNPSKGRLLVDTSMVLTHWEKTDVTDTSKAEDWLPYIDQLRRSLYKHDYQWNFIRADSDDASKGPAGALERQLVEEFREPLKDPAQEENPRRRNGSHGEFTDGRDRYLYYQPIYIEGSACANCHKLMTGDIADGELFAIAKISMPNELTRKDQNRNRALLLTAAIITVFAAMIVAYVIVRYVIVKPLQHLRDVSDAVSHGSLEQRAEIHTADEFEELGVAFNRMLGHLITAQEELRRVNSSLDLKVDELAQANMRLFELNRLKSDFLATMSHELRTPLNSIIGFSEVLTSIKSLDEKQRRYVLNIQKSGKMLLDMINDILDLAKIESGKMELRPSEFRIEHVIAAQCDMARPLAERKNIDIETEVEGRLPELFQDQGKVQQILNNLLSNAIKFTPEGGRVMISARRGPDSDLLLTVADTGVGIAEPDQTQIFEKFRQGNTVMPSGDAMTREYSGTGLGLSIVKELCKLLGGEISLASELGKGSVFTARLPWTLPFQPRTEELLSDSSVDLVRPPADKLAMPFDPAVSAAPSVES
ncbi:MAG: ATP-binding protein [Pirellulales bacterium]